MASRIQGVPAARGSAKKNGQAKRRDNPDEARARLAAIVESSDDAIISKDLNGIITSWNRGAQRIFGYTAREVIGKSVTVLMPPDRVNEEPGILARIRRGESIDHYETVRRRKDGRLLDISLSVSPLKDASGTIIGASKIARDITERKQSQEKLHQQALLLDLSLEPIFIWEIDGGITEWNRGAETLYGFTREEVVGRKSHEVLNTVHPLEIRKFMKSLDANGHWTGELRQGTKDGRELIVESRQQVMTSMGRRLVLETNRDITKRKEAEDALRTSEERFSRFMANLPGLAWIKDIDGRYIFANNSALAAFRTTLDELPGKTDADLFPADTAAGFTANDKRALKKKTGVQTIESLVLEDGTPRHSIVSKFPIPGVDGRPSLIGGMAIDITEQRRIEEEIRRISRMPAENPHPVMRISEDGEIMYANEAAQPLLDFWKRESGLRLPRDFRIRLHEAFRVGLKQDFEVGYDGRTLLATIAPIIEAGYLNFYATDITDRKEAEHRLRVSQNQLRLVTDALPALISYVDNTERYQFVNETYRMWFGIDTKTVIGRSTRDVFGISAYRKLKPWIDEALAGREARFEVLVPYKKGGARYVHGVYVPDIGADGRVRGYYGLTHDMTNLKRSQDLLRSSEERLTLMMETFTDYAMMSSDRDGRIDSWNTGAEHIFGYSSDEMIGRSADILFVPEDVAAGVPAKEMRDARIKGRAVDERWHLRKDGKRFFASGVMMPLYVGKTLTGYAKIASDLTEKKRQAEILQQAHDDLEMRVAQRTRELAESNAALLLEIEQRASAEKQRIDLLGRLVSSQEFERRRIARDLHDQLGQRLTALRLKIASLKELAVGNGNLGERIDRLQEIAERIDTEVSFLAWELRPSTLDDLGLIEAVGAYVTEWSRHYEIPAEFHSAGLGSSRFDRDVETHLYRITQEALNNTVKHAGAGRVSVLLEKMDTNLTLIVEDDGKGFDPMDERVPSDSGHGLGLTGMRERAALVGGDLEIESAKGKGTTIYVRIPVFG